MAAQIKAALVPRHYTVNATVTPDGMYRLVTGLRRLVDEFDAGEEVEQLLAACEEAFVGDLPTAPAMPDTPDEEPGATV